MSKDIGMNTSKAKNKTKSKGKTVLLIIIGILAFFAIFIMIGFHQMGKKTNDALAKQVNVSIDMNKVADGKYQGSSDGGMIQVEVEVEVENHKITNINLLRHDNGKGKPAEVILDDMVNQNTDDVDAVSGATMSSRTIRNAVNCALQKGLSD